VLATWRSRSSPRSSSPARVRALGRVTRCGSAVPATHLVGLAGRPDGRGYLPLRTPGAPPGRRHEPLLRPPAEPRIRRDGQPPELPKCSLRVDPAAAGIPVVEVSHHPLPRRLVLPGRAPALGLIGGHAPVHQAITTVSATSFEEPLVLVDHLQPHELPIGRHSQLPNDLGPYWSEASAPVTARGVGSRWGFARRP